MTALGFVAARASVAEAREEIIYFEKERDGIQVEIAMQYTEAYNESVFCYANNINTIDGGSHEDFISSGDGKDLVSGGSGINHHREAGECPDRT